MDWNDWKNMSQDERAAAASAYINEQLEAKGLRRSRKGRPVRVYPIMGYAPITVLAVPLR